MLTICVCVQEWGKHYIMLIDRLKSLREEELVSALSSQTFSASDVSSSVLVGLLYGILVDSSHATKYFKVLGSVTRDSYSGCVEALKSLVLDRFPRLLDLPRGQLVWIVSSMVQLRVSDVDILFTALLRQVVTGNTHLKNLALVSELLTMISSNRDWLYSHPPLIPIIVHMLATIIPDHHRPELESLRERETAVIVQLMRERLDAVRLGGRDLVRSLYNISLIPEIKNLWEQVLLAPAEVGIAPNNLRALLSTPTSKHVLSSRITPEMETWLTFLFTNVKYGTHTWYQKWFAAKFLSSPENDTLVPDLIRWIVGAHHPTNAVLQSNIIPRYKVIGWLIGGCARNAHVQQNARQALFYDWLFYTPTKDNIMNLEPAALLLMNTLQKEPPFVAALSEHLMVSTDNYLVNYYPQMREEVRKSVHLASKLMLEKKVVTTFEPLYASSHLPPNLRDALKKVFENTTSKQLANTTPQQAQTRATQESPPAALQTPTVATSSLESNTNKTTTSNTPPPTQKKDITEAIQKAKVSSKPPADIPPLAKASSSIIDSPGNASMFDGWKAALTSSRSTNGGSETSRMEVDLTPSDVRHSQEIMVTSASPRISRYAEQLAAVSSRVEVGSVRLARNAFETFLKQAHSDFAEMECSSIDLADICTKLLQTLTPELTEQVAATFPSPVNFVHTQLFTELLETYEKKPGKGKRTAFAMQLLVALREREKSFGWRFLVFLLSSQHSLYPMPLSIVPPTMDDEELFDTLVSAEEEKGRLESRDSDSLSEPTWMQSYLDLLGIVSKATHREIKDLFAEDTKLMVGASVNLANDTFPLVCRYLPSLCTGNAHFLHLMIQALLPQHMVSVHADLSSQTYKLVGEDLSSMIQASLQWDSYSQQLFWNVVSSEYLFHSDTIIAALGEMLGMTDLSKEALQGSLSLLSLVGPVSQLIQSVLSLDVRYYEYMTAVFTRWMVEDEFQNELAKRLPGVLSALSKAGPSSSSSDSSFIKNALMNFTLAYTLMPSDVGNLLEHAPLRRSLLLHLKQSIKKNLDSFETLRDVCMAKDDKEKAVETKRGSKKRVHPQPEAPSESEDTTSATNASANSSSPSSSSSSQGEAAAVEEVSSKSSAVAPRAKRRKVNE